MKEKVGLVIVVTIVVIYYAVLCLIDKEVRNDVFKRRK